VGVRPDARGAAFVAGAFFAGAYCAAVFFAAVFFAAVFRGVGRLRGAGRRGPGGVTRSGR
jgi:hypothetical protein